MRTHGLEREVIPVSTLYGCPLELVFSEAGKYYFTHVLDFENEQTAQRWPRELQHNAGVTGVGNPSLPAPALPPHFKKKSQMH